jgi:hypothetical protein
MAIVAIIAALLIILAWFLWPSKTAANASPARRERPGVDEAELEAAERDVQESPDEESVRDWGPGSGKKPLP